MNPANPAEIARSANALPGDSEAQAAQTTSAAWSLNKSAILDRAYDEYCQRIESGDRVDPEEFCDRFPGFQSSLHRLLEAHRFIHENPLLLRNLQPVDWPETGQTFLGFNLLRELGRGTFARVFLARELAIGNRLVAVKIARQGGREAGTLGRLDHPNVVPIHSIQTDAASGLTAICMPYLGSATLADVIPQVIAAGSALNTSSPVWKAIEAKADADAENVPDRALQRGHPGHVDEVRCIAIALADALAFVHAKGILHRDLKPSNVLLSVDGQPRLLDFNLSDDPEIETARIGGTLPYMSPEHLRAAFAAEPALAAGIDVRSDLFSLGVVLYELLTGKHPFGPIPKKLEGELFRSWVLERQARGPRPLLDENPNVDRRLARVVDSCLAFNPDDRPDSAKVLATRLRKSMPSPQRGWNWIRGQSWKVHGCALTILLGTVVLATWAASRYSERGRSAPERVPVRAEAIDEPVPAGNVEPQNATEFFDRGRSRMRQGQFSLALADLQSANQIASTGPTLASIGYCLSSLKQHGEAVIFFHKAIDAGFGPPELWNDLGYANLMLGKYNDASVALNETILRGPRLQAGYYNRVCLHLNWARNKREKSAALGAADAEKAIALGPPTTDLLRDAAYLNALAGNPELALEFLSKAVDQGLDLSRYLKDPALDSLRSLSAFDEIAKRPLATVSASKAVRLVDPVPDAR